jgi:hypothetical protein
MGISIMSRREKRKVNQANRLRAARSDSDAVATIAQYGPDDKTVTKIVASHFNRPGGPIKAMKRWVQTGITEDPAFRQELFAFLTSRNPSRIALTKGVMGCIHEEGEDYPEGEVCPLCPFWAGRDRFAKASMVVAHVQDFEPDRPWPGRLNRG